MAVELRPLGVSCNIGCRYCYQEPQRAAGNFRQAYDLDAMKAAVERAGGPLVLFGGEPLLMPREDLEDLLRWAKGKWGRSAIQTNGALIDDDHLRMFREHEVDVGISIDGPAELNDARWAGSLERTRATTARVEAMIERLCREQRPPGLIVTLHRGNAAAERLPLLCDWLRRLDALGVRAVRLHVLEIDDGEVGRDLALTARENVAALAGFAAMEGELRSLRLDFMDDLRALLRGRDRRVACIWHACDPYTTEAVRGVEGNGQASNCGRTNKDGVDFVKADVAGFERYLALARTPEEHGGCAGCRFFLFCKGQCPGTAIDGDFRNRTEHCEVWKSLFSHVERQLVVAGEVPLSLSPLRRRLERQLLVEWEAGHNPSIEALAKVTGHGDPTPPEGVARRHPTARIAWTSDDTRRLWEPRLRELAGLEAELAFLQVEADPAHCVVLRAPPGDVYPLVCRAVAAQLAAEVLPDPPPGESDLLVAGWPRAASWLVLGRPDVVEAYRQALACGDVDAALSLAAVPDCCRAFHRRLSGGDPAEATWASAAAGTDGGDALELEAAPHTNRLLAALGLTLLRHAPCTPACAPSRRRVEERLARGRAAGYSARIDQCLEVLSWPVSWSELHGIVEIKAPVCKIVGRAPFTATRRALRYGGARSVEGMAHGLRFPFAPPRRPAALRVLS